MEAAAVRMPPCLAAFRGGWRLGAVALSVQMRAVVRRLPAGGAMARPGSGLSRREWREWTVALGREERM